MPTEREKQIEEAARKDRAERLEILVDVAVKVLEKACDPSTPVAEQQYRAAVAELAKLTRAHHGMIEAHQTAIIEGQSLLLRLMEALTKSQDDARKLAEKLAGVMSAVHPQGFGR